MGVNKTKYNITKENEVVLYELIQSYGNISNKEISDKLKKNYTLNHFIERIKIYNEENFNYEIVNIFENKEDAQLEEIKLIREL